MPGTKVVVAVNVRPESRAIQRVGDVVMKTDRVEAVKVLVSKHVAFLDPRLVVRRCIVNVVSAIVMLDTHKHIEELGPTLNKRVLTVRLEEREGNKGPRVVVGLGMRRHDVGKLTKSLADVFLLLDGSVSKRASKLVKLRRTNR